MPDIFADTAGWGHLVDASQEYHPRAATLFGTRLPPASARPSRPLPAADELWRWVLKT